MASWESGWTPRRVAWSGILEATGCVSSFKGCGHHRSGVCMHAQTLLKIAKSWTI